MGSGSTRGGRPGLGFDHRDEFGDRRISSGDRPTGVSRMPAGIRGQASPSGASRLDGPWIGDAETTASPLRLAGRLIVPAAAPTSTTAGSQVSPAEPRTRNSNVDVVMPAVEPIGIGGRLERALGIGDRCVEPVTEECFVGDAETDECRHLGEHGTGEGGCDRCDHCVGLGARSADLDRLDRLEIDVDVAPALVGAELRPAPGRWATPSAPAASSSSGVEAASCQVSSLPSHGPGRSTRPVAPSSSAPVGATEHASTRSP